MEEGLGSALHFFGKEERLEVDESVSVYSNCDVFQSPPFFILSCLLTFVLLYRLVLLPKDAPAVFLYFPFLCMGKEGFCRNESREVREPFLLSLCTFAV